MPKVVITEGPETGKEYTIDQAVILGRLDSNDIPIHDRKASREHAKIYRQGDRFAIVDLNSSNGTFVNGEKITKHILAEGDQIRIGVVSLRFEDPEAEAAHRARPSGRKSLDEAFESADRRSAGGAAPEAGHDRIVLTGHQPLQYHRIKRGNPVLGFDFDQLSDTARLVLYVGLVVVFGLLIYLGYALVAP